MIAFDRRMFLKMAAGGACLAGLSGKMSAAWASNASELKKAQAEGEAVFYANITAVEPIMKAFHQKTGVAGEYTRISSTKFIQTVLAEANAGKLLADVVQAPRPMIEFLGQRDVLTS